MNNLYKHTPLQTTFSVNFVALVDGVPRTLNLREALVHYVAHQVEVITRRSQYRLDKARRRAHIVEGFLKALDLIDEIIAAIRASADRPSAITALQAEQFAFSEIQATEIVDMRLSTLTRLGRERLEDEMRELRATIAELEAILADDAKLRAVIKEEITAIRDEFATPRKTSLEHDDGDLEIEDLIDDEEVVVVMTARGYIKTVAVDAFRSQSRGGRGVAGAALKDEDYITHLIHTSAHAYLLFFSNRGRVYRLKAHRIPMRDRTAQGLAIVNLLRLQPDETIQTIIDTRDYETQPFLFFVTRKGVVKKTLFTAYDTPRQDGLIALGLRDDDELVRVLPTSGSDDILIVSGKGQCIRFTEEQVRAMGRTAAGVRGMRLRDGDGVVGADAVRDGLELLTVTDGGYGKRTVVEEFSRRGRGGQGVRAHGNNAERGHLVSAVLVDQEDDVLLINDLGVLIRTPVHSISQQGRSANGVRVMQLSGESKVAAVARVLGGERSEDDPDDGDHGDPDQRTADDSGADPGSTGASGAGSAGDARAVTRLVMHRRTPRAAASMVAVAVVLLSAVGAASLARLSTAASGRARGEAAADLGALGCRVWWSGRRPTGRRGERRGRDPSRRRPRRRSGRGDPLGRRSGPCVGRSGRGADDGSGAWRRAPVGSTREHDTAHRATRRIGRRSGRRH